MGNLSDEVQYSKSKKLYTSFLLLDISIINKTKIHCIIIAHSRAENMIALNIIYIIFYHFSSSVSALSESSSLTAGVVKLRLPLPIMLLLFFNSGFTLLLPPAAASDFCATSCPLD